MPTGSSGSAEMSAEWNIAALTQRPEIAALGCTFRIDPALGATRPFLVNARRDVALAPLLFESDQALALTVARQAGEYAVPQHLMPEASAVFAALWSLRVGVRFLATFPRTQQEVVLAALPSWLGDVYRATAREEALSLIAVDHLLACSVLPHTPATRQEIDQATAEILNLGEICAPVDQLLLRGGDGRLDLDSATGLNRYFCPARPDGSRVAFASTTASTATGEGFVAAEQERWSILGKIRDKAAPNTLGDGIRQDIARLIGGDPAAVLLTPSGTDAELMTVALVHGLVGCPLTNIIIAPTETGRGVVLAGGGRHYEDRAPLGGSVVKGAEIGGFRSDALETVRIPIRPEIFSSPQPLPESEVDQAVSAAVESAVARGRHVLLHLVDVSKTGLIFPSIASLLALRERFAGQMTVAVDACQVRLSRQVIAAYWSLGFIVTITGSKFLGGPAFCGALLLPDPTLLSVPLPSGLAAYSAASDWPFPRQEPLTVPSNIGLLLRWRAALAEAEEMACLGAEQRRDTVRRLSETIGKALEKRAWATVLPAPALDRTALGLNPDWSSERTIFPILISDSSGFLRPMQNLKEIHRSLALGARPCLFGQPVELGLSDRGEIGALRIALSARDVIEAARNGAGETASKLAFALDALEQIMRNGHATLPPTGR